MGHGGWLQGGVPRLSPAAQPAQGLHQGRVLGVGFPFSIQTAFRGSSLWLSLIFGVLPWRAVPVGFPYQQDTTATWLWKDKRRWLNPELQRSPCLRAFCSRVGFYGGCTDSQLSSPPARGQGATAQISDTSSGTHDTRQHHRMGASRGKGNGRVSWSRSRTRLHRGLGVTQCPSSAGAAELDVPQAGGAAQDRFSTCRNPAAVTPGSPHYCQHLLMTNPDP